jgi:hypothetical protein
MSYECSDEGTYTQNIHYSSARSHASRVAPGIAAEIAFTLYSLIYALLRTYVIVKILVIH